MIYSLLSKHVIHSSHLTVNETKQTIKNQNPILYSSYGSFCHSKQACCVSSCSINNKNMYDQSQRWRIRCLKMCVCFLSGQIHVHTSWIFFVFYRLVFMTSSQWTELFIKKQFFFLFCTKKEKRGKEEMLKYFSIFVSHFLCRFFSFFVLFILLLAFLSQIFLYFRSIDLYLSLSSLRHNTNQFQTEKKIVFNWKEWLMSITTTKFECLKRRWNETREKTNDEGNNRTLKIIFFFLGDSMIFCYVLCIFNRLFFSLLSLLKGY